MRAHVLSLRTRAVAVGAVLGALVAAAVGGLRAVHAQGGGAVVCSAEPSVLVDAAAHRLYLCDGGRPVAEYRVSLGSGGLGKTRRGDARTPLGRYALAPPRGSRRYGTFIPVGYPTAEQARRGFTGSDIGIHGPPRGFGWVGPLATITDWTLGCIAVSSDAEIGEIARWVRARRARRIELR